MIENKLLVVLWLALIGGVVWAILDIRHRREMCISRYTSPADQSACTAGFGEKE